MKRIRSAVTSARPVRLATVELSGLACIVYGVGQVSIPAAWMVGGAFATLEAVLSALNARGPTT